MGDRKSSSSSKGGDTSSKSSQSQPIERTQMSQQSQSDPAATAMTRGFSAPHGESSTAKERRPSKESIESDVGDDYTNGEPYEEEPEEEPKPTITKRHSSSGRVNVYTECGRHGDDWLFGGISDLVKSVVAQRKNEK